jgi:hypothetical protein
MQIKIEENFPRATRRKRVFSEGWMHPVILNRTVPHFVEDIKASVQYKTPTIDI